MVTVSSTAVATTMFLLSMHNFVVVSNVGTGKFWLVLQISHVCGHMHI